VLRPEHLTAIMVQTGRDKDRQRFSTFLREAEMEEDDLRGVLERHQLTERFNTWKSMI
jgi:hypothetical protein